MTTLISDQELLHYNQLGLIPGPKESAEEFISRVNYCLTLNEHISQELESHLGTSKQNSRELLDKGFRTVTTEYDISPNWIPIFFSNYQLPPWHGGCAWIFQMTESSPTAALMQLRQSLKNSSIYLGMYHRDELVAHELTHVGRMKFEEPQFEELLAYRTSHSTFRRWFGPLIQSSLESMLFVLILVLIIFVDLFLIAFENYETYLSAAWLKAIPISMICFALVRLWWRQYRFDKCLNQLKLCFRNASNSQAALSVIYRLTDREINDFSKMNMQEIKEYASKKGEESLRWQVINHAYFKENV